MRFGPVAWPCPADLWEQAGPMLERSVRRTEEEDMGDMVAALSAGTAQLWLGGDAQVVMAAVTRFIEVRGGLAMEYWHVGGSGVRKWFGMMTSVLEDEARRAGCVKMTTGCRVGWSRLAADYRVTAVKLEKVL